MATPVPLCTHIKPSGATCGSLAVSGTALCYHHSAVKSALAKVVPLDQVPYGAHSPIPFVFPEDRASLQINLFLLLKAFNEKRIDQRAATIMHRILRAMSANLGARPLTEDKVETPASPASAPTSDPDSDANPAPSPALMQPARSCKVARQVSPNQDQPAPGPTSDIRKPAPATPPLNTPVTPSRTASTPSQSSPLPPSSHGPTRPSIDPASAFTAVYAPSKAPAYPPAYPSGQTDRKSMGALSPEGQRIISIFTSKPD